jgi:hypothetical protein
MRKSILLTSFAALCATVSAASAMPIAPAPTADEIVTPVTYYGYGYRHRYYHRHYYRPYGYYGYYRPGYRHHRHWYW